jgi:hypothetical protein
MEEAENIVAQTLLKSLERRGFRVDATTVDDMAGVIVEALAEAGLVVEPMGIADLNEMDAKHPGWDRKGDEDEAGFVEPAQEDVDRVAKAIEKAGHAWIDERDPKRESTGWADVPEDVFARAALVEFLNPAAPSEDAAKGIKP